MERREFLTNTTQQPCAVISAATVIEQKLKTAVFFAKPTQTKVSGGQYDVADTPVHYSQRADTLRALTCQHATDKDKADAGGLLLLTIAVTSTVARKLTRSCWFL